MAGMTGEKQGSLHHFAPELTTALGQILTNLAGESVDFAENRSVLDAYHATARTSRSGAFASSGRGCRSRVSVGGSRHPLPPLNERHHPIRRAIVGVLMNAEYHIIHHSDSPSPPQGRAADRGHSHGNRQPRHRHAVPLSQASTATGAPQVLARAAERVENPLDFGRVTLRKPRLGPPGQDRGVSLALFRRESQLAGRRRDRS